MSEDFPTRSLWKNWRGASETKRVLSRLLLSRARFCFTWQMEPSGLKPVNQSSDIGAIPLKTSTFILRATKFPEEPNKKAQADVSAWADERIFPRELGFGDGCLLAKQVPV